MLDVLDERVYALIDMFENYHRYTRQDFLKQLSEIESVVDQIVSANRPTKVTDFKYRVFSDILTEYENTIDAVKDAILLRDYSRAKTLIRDVPKLVRRLARHLQYLSAEIYTPEITRELEKYLPKEKIAEGLTTEDTFRDLSYTAKAIFASLQTAPLRELNLRELPAKIGVTDTKLISDACEELVRKLPNLVEIVPDTLRKGMKIKLKV